MDNEAGQKRKEFTSKSKSAIKNVGGGVKNFWFNWFGDLQVRARLWWGTKKLLYIIIFIIIFTLGWNLKEAWQNETREARLDYFSGGKVKGANVEQSYKLTPLQELQNSIKSQNKNLPKRGG